MPDLELNRFSVYILHALAEGKDHHALAEAICRFAETFIQGKVASLMVLGASGTLNIYAAPNAPSALIEAFSNLRPGPRAGSCGNVAFRNEAMEVGDIPADERWEDFRGLAETWGLRSCWSYPIRQGARFIGTFAITGFVSEAPSPEQRFVMEFCAALAGTVLVHRDMEQREAAERRLYQALFGSLGALIENGNDVSMMSDLCCRLTEQTDFSAVWIGKPDADGRFAILAMAGEGTDQVAEARPKASFEPGSPLIVRAWATGDSVLSNDVLADASLEPWHALYRRNRWASLLALPIWRQQSVWAVMVLTSHRVGVFEEATIRLCHRLVRLLSQSLDDFDIKSRIEAMQHQEAQLARTDRLTGLPNRLACEEYLPRALARAERHQRVMAVGMLDLDDFKPVNDRWGHVQGDTLLQELARRMRQQIRESNFVARLGGDEFVIVLEDLQEGEAVDELQNMLERLHQAVEQPFKVGELGTEVWLEMTMGVALFPGDGVTPEELLRSADVAMYQNKTRKLSRHQWWALKSGMHDVPAAELPFDPFGQEAMALLNVLKKHLDPMLREYVGLLHEDIQRHVSRRHFPKNLSDNTVRSLQASQTEQLVFLLSPSSTVEGIVARSRELGQIHALVGVTGAMLTRSMSLLRGTLRKHLDRPPQIVRDRYRMLRVADARLQIDLEAQLDAMQSINDQYNTYFNLALDFSLPWTEKAPREAEMLAELRGIVATHLMLPQADGTFMTEFYAGKLALSVEQAFSQPHRRPVMDSRQAAGQGLVAQAWHTGQIQRTDAYDQDDRTQTWCDQLYPLGVRSAVAIPVRGSQEPECILVLLGEYPNQFSANWMRTFVTSVQNRWEQLVRQRRIEHRLLVDIQTAASYRERLHSGGLKLFVQPVLDMETGSVFKVEALARLLLADGTLLGPGQFLGVLRSADLDALFRLGLNQALQFLADWSAAGLNYSVSLNLPPGTLLHPECVGWVEQAMSLVGIEDPQRLTLELLESQEVDRDAADAAVERLEKLGVQLAIDDLGSGFSSLKRLATLPFDVIKVDQGMVRDILREPIKTMTLIRTIVQIGLDLERVVIIEGVENLDILEAVTLLGARYIQGYAVAKPMPMNRFMDWVEHGIRDMKLDQPLRIRTYLGALAYHWRYMHNASQGAWAMPVSAGEDCPVHRFLVDKGWGDTEVVHWHRAVHAASKDVRREASLKLRAWLIARVQDEKDRS